MTRHFQSRRTSLFVRDRGGNSLHPLPPGRRSGRSGSIGNGCRGAARIFHAVRALALRGAGLRPLVLVFEDMHWADFSTQEYLDFFIDSVAGVRLMLS
jgi:predicted ATPase